MKRIYVIGSKKELIVLSGQSDRQGHKRIDKSVRVREGLTPSKLKSSSLAYTMIHLFFLLTTGGSRAATIAYQGP